MTIRLKQNTASQEVPLGYFLDSTDGNTEETGLTIANTDIKLWKNGATTLANKNSGGATHISNGIYYAVLDATDTNTLGPLVIFVHVTGALPVRLECEVLAANVYDSLVGGGDLLQVDTTQVGGTAQTAGDIIADTNDIQGRLPAALVGGRIDANVGAMGTDVLTSTALAASAVTEIQSGLATSAAVAAVQADTDDIQSRLPAALVGGRMDASVGAMAANTLTASALATDAVDEIVDAVWDEPLVGHATAGSTGAALSAAGSAGDPWSTPLPGAYGAGTAGNIIGNNLDAAVSTRLAGASYTAPLDAAGTRSAVGLASANLDTQLSGIQSDTNDIQTRIPAALVAGRMDASVGAMAANVVTASAVAADAVTEIQSGLATAASLATVDGKADAILADTAEIGVAGAGLTALASAANLATLSGYVDTEVAAIKAQTDKLTFNASNAVKANITHVIDDAVQQNGSTTTNWGGTP
ncbi:MAG: hypothetical protein AB7F22_05455 [Reyranella sp.]|uniref:hypothetical protein n=1 Tax=Reyranella sp. TaxID=1929291 RepID=UPI003D118525